MPRKKAAEELVRLHLTIPRSQYDRMVALTGIGASSTQTGRGYGRLSYIMRLAINHYLDAAQSNPPTFQEENLAELAQL